MLVLGKLLVALGRKLDLEILECPRPPLALIVYIRDHRLQICDYDKLILVELPIGLGQVLGLKVERRRPQGLHHPGLEDRHRILEIAWS
jgi:hypothetical protein